MADTRRNPRTAFERVAPRVGGWPPVIVGAIAIVLTLLAVYFAYNKNNPFANPYRMAALFNDVNDLKKGSPVRIAGVTVGEVTEVQPVEEGSGLVRAEMTIADAGLPIKEDAEVAVRSRIFLEGNYFIDVRPGSPSAPELEDGSTIPPNQTASPVQFGEVLTALQMDTRENLRTFLDEYSTALDKGGARGFNRAAKHWAEAYRNTAMVNEATLGVKPHDLSGVLRGQARVFGALARDEQSLKELVTNLNRTAAAFAREGDSLRAAIPQLRDVLRVGRPALQSLNSGLPSLRAFAQDATPAARTSDDALAAQLPFVKQARKLVRPRELGGLAQQLRRTVPQLARLNLGQTRSFEQVRQLASCQNNVLIPFSREPIPHPFFKELDGEPFSEQSPRALVGLSGESRLSDANSPFFRVQAGGGPITLAATGETGEDLFAQLDFPLEGLVPLVPKNQPRFRPDVPCETQEVPNLDPVVGGPELAGDVVNPSASGRPDAREKERLREQLTQLDSHLERVEDGLPSIDPLTLGTGKGARREARAIDLKLTDDGSIVERGGGDGE